MSPRPFLLGFLALAACTDAHGPGMLGLPWFSGALPLRSINGQDIPWESPVQPGYFITAGQVTIIDDTLAERSERLEFRQADTVVGVAEWSRSGSWKQTAGRLIITYPALPPSSGFTIGFADTFSVSAGSLILEEIGGVGSTFGTTVRVYCRALC